MNILVCCNKRDYFLTKICVASIRYYYPQIPIYILKDDSNGAFDTSELENTWDVSKIEYPEKKFGWSASKMFFYTDLRFSGKNFLVLDSDIVLIGRMLDEPWAKSFDEDVIISPEATLDPTTEWFTRTYFDLQVIRKEYPDYEFQRYTFNCGQMFCKPGFIDRSDVAAYFDFENFPRWKRLDLMPLVDQSLFNFMLPRMEKQGRLKVGKYPFMYWSESQEVRDITLDKVLDGKSLPMLIHWAGALRVRDTSKMTRPDILAFFETFYYSKVPGGKIKHFFKRKKATASFHLNKPLRKGINLAKKVLGKPVLPG